MGLITKDCSLFLPSPPSKRIPRRTWASSRSRPTDPKRGGATGKAEVIAILKRVKGATPSEIMKATGLEPHTLRGFVSIMGTKSGRNFQALGTEAFEWSALLARHPHLMK